MAGWLEGGVTGGFSGAAAGYSLGPVGMAVGGTIGAVMGGLTGQSAKRAKKWQQIAADRIAEFNALQNRRQLLASVRTLRAQRAAQLQLQSTDLSTFISGASGAISSIGAQAAYNYEQFDLDIYHQNRIQDALNRAGSAGAQAASYAQTGSIFNTLLSSYGTVVAADKAADAKRSETAFRYGQPYATQSSYSRYNNEWAVGSNVSNGSVVYGC